MDTNQADRKNQIRICTSTISRQACELTFGYYICQKMNNDHALISFIIIYQNAIPMLLSPHLPISHPHLQRHCKFHGQRVPSIRGVIHLSKESHQKISPEGGAGYHSISQFDRSMHAYMLYLIPDTDQIIRQSLDGADAVLGCDVFVVVGEEEGLCCLCDDHAVFTL